MKSDSVINETRDAAGCVRVRVCVCVCVAGGFRDRLCVSPCFLSWNSVILCWLGKNTFNIQQLGGRYSSHLIMASQMWSRSNGPARVYRR